MKIDKTSEKAEGRVAIVRLLLQLHDMFLVQTIAWDVNPAI